MTPAEAQAYALPWAGPLVGFVMTLAVILLAFALLKDLSR